MESDKKDMIDNRIVEDKKTTVKAFLDRLWEVGVRYEVFRGYTKSGRIAYGTIIEDKDEKYCRLQGIVCDCGYSKCCDSIDVVKPIRRVICIYRSARYGMDDVACEGDTFVVKLDDVFVCTLKLSDVGSMFLELNSGYSDVSRRKFNRLVCKAALEQKDCENILEAVGALRSDIRCI